MRGLIVLIFHWLTLVFKSHDTIVLINFFVSRRHNFLKETINRTECNNNIPNTIHDTNSYKLNIYYYYLPVNVSVNEWI
jgi:hypothetical protein